MELRYDGMYVLFPSEPNDYYYFLRIFEDDKASGKMITGNFEFEEFYLNTYYELEKKRNFVIEKIGNQILLTSNLIFDLRGSIYFDKLRLVGQLKNGKPWMKGEVLDYYFIPFNFINDPRKVWIVSKEKSPLAIYIKDRDCYLNKQIHEPINYLDYPMNTLVLEDEKIVGTYMDGKLVLFNEEND